MIVDGGRLAPPSVDERAIYEELADLMPRLRRDYETVKAKTAPLAMHYEEVLRRSVAYPLPFQRPF